MQDLDSRVETQRSIMSTSMEIESQVGSHHHQEALNKDKMEKSFLKKALLLLNCALLGIGTTGGPLLLRLYFVRGGKRVWLSSWLETAGWPILLLPLSVSYIHRRTKATREEAKLFFITPRLFVAGAALGILTGCDDYMYAQGMSRLPASTAALIISTQLAFTAGFAFLIVKQKFTSYSVNSIVMLTAGAIVLGVHTSSDRPNGESNKEYFLGFFMTLGASALYGFVLPMVEYTYKKTKQRITYSLVMEMQLVISAFATAFCTVGMLVNHDFQAMPREARENEYGKVVYYMVLVWNAIIWQFFFLGATGVISCASSLLSGILIAVLLPVTEILAVVIYHENFTVDKGISLGLSLWGFVSYFYGELKENREKKRSLESETPDT